jgi:photosystem II stability/assembly factor-like uncharacterized protein
MTRYLLVAVSLLGLLPGSALAQKPTKSKAKPAPAKTAASASAAVAGPALTPVLVKALKARSIGPAIMSGRVSTIALDPQDPYTFYVGLGTGGVMKTTDNGGSFQGVFEHESVAAIGAIAVSPAAANLVWVGTGEANDRNSSSWGDGVYRSGDGGQTWTRAGLLKSKTIARIALHPSDTNVAYVAAMGELWGPGGERGLYKTVDGGKTWKAVLTAPAPYQDRVGAGDVIVDPSDPNVVYAALYARQRTPWSFVVGADYTDGKDVGGIFKSTDGGATWRKLAGGLPARTGRIGLDLFRKNPKVVYAVVQSDAGGTTDIDSPESRAGGVFRSDDGGETWTRMNALDPRPFYFSQIRVDPQNDQRVYVLGFMLHVSDDGGRTFREDLFKNVHPDNHELVIDPRNPKRLLLGTDGGAYQSFTQGAGWQSLNRMAAGEFYRINVDLSTPYRICGGLQDNVNWVGPSMTQSKDGILNGDWTNVQGGDGFYCFFDAEKPNLVFAESQAGEVHRMDLATGEVKVLRPEPTEGQPAFRFHWNSPLIPSRHAAGSFYLGGNRVFKLTARGDHFQVISPDLSTRDPLKTTTTGSGAENYGVVYTLAESPLKAGLLWAGTDDGKLWVTEDDGGKWTDLTANLPPASKGLWMSRIEASWSDPAVAYLAVDGHRSLNYAPFAYRTGDGGKTWQSIVGDLPDNGPVKVVREDPKNANLLYTGTEFALFVSADRGGHWVRLGDLPTVAVDDILVHPRDLDLVIATHGRSLFILDDVSPLQQLSPEIADKGAYLFPPRPASGFYQLPGWTDWEGSAVFRGANPPEGAILTYYVKAYTGVGVSIAITDAKGKPVANLTGPGTPGFNRLSWNLRVTKDLLTEYGGEPADRLVAPGEYTVKLSYGDLKQEQKLKVDIPEGVETR